MNAFSPSANVPSEVVDACICSVMLMDDSSSVGQLRSISWMSGSLNPCTHHLALALYPVSVSFQRKARKDHPCTLFFSDHIRLRGIYDRHSLEIEYCLPFVFDCFRELRSVLGRKVFPRYLVGVPSTEIKFSLQLARRGRRNRKGAVFLAFSDVEASSLLPCLLDVHRSFFFGRRPSSLSVTLHRLNAVSRRSFLDHAHVKSPSNWVIACGSCTHLGGSDELISEGWKGTADSLVSVRLGVFPRGSTTDSRSEDASK